MKYTNLDLVQTILSSLDSDEVNSVGDTPESRQVAKVLRTAYFNILSRANLPEHTQLFTLNPSLDGDKPTLMYVPPEVTSIKWIKYNISEDSDTEYAYVTILPIDQFLDYLHGVSPDDADVGSFSIGDFDFYYRNNQAPRYCTILEDYYVIFDAYDADEDTTLQANKTQCYGRKVPSYNVDSDTFTPDLDDELFPLLINEAKTLAFLELKQLPHSKSEQEARRQWVTVERNKHLKKDNPLYNLPHYGRK